MTPVELSRTVLCAVRRAVDEGELSVAVPARAVVTAPGPGGRGDYATSIALQLARPAGQAPLRVAEVLRPYLMVAEGVCGVEITGPGFLNISLDGSAAGDLVRRIGVDGLRYGHTDDLAGEVFEVRVPYEVRAEVLADVLARIIGAQGGRVDVSHDVRHDVRHDVAHGDGVRDVGGGRGGTVLRPVPAPEDPAPLGLDAARWALLHPAPHDRPRITADHLVQREGNPLFRVRYAHARTRAMCRNAADLGFAAEPGPVDAAGLVGLLADYPRVLATAVAPSSRPSGPSPEPLVVPDSSAPSRLTRHLVGVADATLVLLPAVLPRGEEKPSAAHRARLALAEAAGAVLAGGLSLLGIDAPDHL
ncbi:ArgS-related anticodon-binding protein NrtL [Streptomyces scabiei]|uniref:ArgS-related anticodon-binding protein NrtL n=1 Tax=Streptomyces scabiei TaxID=1930 RepID=UPI0029BC7B70|nr:DALR anticodon-binding domain-containing protein [Streptomyces scabiei]MDX3114465.1 DALR anticodon-binding domain-containing protein [Streptomyces scabiei]